MSLGSLGDFLTGWSAVMKKQDPEPPRRQPFHCLVCDVWGSALDPCCWVCGSDDAIELKSIPGPSGGHTYGSTVPSGPDLSLLTWRQFLDGNDREEAAS